MDNRSNTRDVAGFGESLTLLAAADAGELQIGANPDQVVLDMSGEGSFELPQDNGTKSTPDALTGTPPPINDEGRIDNQSLVTYEVVYKTDTNQPPMRQVLDVDAYDKTLPQEPSDKHKIRVRKTAVVETVVGGKLGTLGSLRPVQIVDEHMTIESPSLKAAMKEAVGYYPSGAWHSSSNTMLGQAQTLKIYTPYRMIGIEARRKLVELQTKYEADAAAAPTEESSAEYGKLAAEIRSLNQEITRAQGQRLDEEAARYRKSPPTATFDNIWILLRPGTIVLTEVDDELVPYCLNILTWNSNDKGIFNAVDAHLWRLKFDGSKLNRERFAVAIFRFDGERPITELKVYPLSYSTDLTLRQRLIVRGRRAYQLLSHPFAEVDYQGSVYRFEAKRKGENYFGSVMVDPRFADANGNISSNIKWMNRNDIDAFADSKMKSFVDIDPLDPDNQLTDDHYLLMPSTLSGFTLGTRKWRFIDVDFAQEHVYDKSLLDTLILRDSDKKNIKALSDWAHSDSASMEGRSKPFVVEPIRGKGQGVTFLLHGSPGTGKTFTAECISEYTGRPLLRLSTADLGTTPTALETGLLRWFRYALHWGAITIIDEAEVYMRQRSSGDVVAFAHEASVSIFLRSLDYYRGILFLTTNQPLKLDWAIMNRVTYTARFDDLFEDSKKHIREQAVARVESRPRYDVYGSAKEAWAEMDKVDYITNGRQIINFIQQSLALAEADAATAVQASGGNEKDEAHPSSPDGRVSVKDVHVKEILESAKRQHKYEMDGRWSKTARQLAVQRGEIGPEEASSRGQGQR